VLQDNYLYKYIGEQVDRIGTILILNKLYFASPNKFNDPFDCATTISFSDFDEDDLKQYYYHLMKSMDKSENKELNRTYQEIKDEAEYGIATGKYKNEEFLNQCSEEIQKKVKELAAQYGILCLTKNPKNILMWTHYADKHKGIVFQFDKSRLIDEYGNDKCFQISYKHNFPSLKEYMSLVGKGDFKELVKLFYFVKSKDWQYEQEWRIFGTDPDKYKDIPEGMLTGIIFGWKMSDENKKLIRAWNSSRENPLTIYQAEPSSNSFEMVIISENGECL
jgi:hypothetical protein